MSGRVYAKLLVLLMIITMVTPACFKNNGGVKVIDELSESKNETSSDQPKKDHPVSEQPKKENETAKCQAQKCDQAKIWSDKECKCIDDPQVKKDEITQNLILSSAQIDEETLQEGVDDVLKLEGSPFAKDSKKQAVVRNLEDSKVSVKSIDAVTEKSWISAFADVDKFFKEEFKDEGANDFEAFLKRTNLLLVVKSKECQKKEESSKVKEEEGGESQDDNKKLESEQIGEEDGKEGDKSEVKDKVKGEKKEGKKFSVMSKEVAEQVKAKYGFTIQIEKVALTTDEFVAQAIDFDLCGNDEDDSSGNEPAPQTNAVKEAQDKCVAACDDSTLLPETMCRGGELKRNKVMCTLDVGTEKGTITLANGMAQACQTARTETCSNVPGGGGGGNQPGDVGGGNVPVPGNRNTPGVNTQCPQGCMPFGIPGSGIQICVPLQQGASCGTNGRQGVTCQNNESEDRCRRRLTCELSSGKLQGESCYCNGVVAERGWCNNCGGLDLNACTERNSCFSSGGTWTQSSGCACPSGYKYSSSLKSCEIQCTSGQVKCSLSSVRNAGKCVNSDNECKAVSSCSGQSDSTPCALNGGNGFCCSGSCQTTQCSVNGNGGIQPGQQAPSCLGTTSYYCIELNICTTQTACNAEKKRDCERFGKTWVDTKGQCEDKKTDSSGQTQTQSSEAHAKHCSDECIIEGSTEMTCSADEKSVNTCIRDSDGCLKWICTSKSDGGGGGSGSAVSPQ